MLENYFTSDYSFIPKQPLNSLIINNNERRGLWLKLNSEESFNNNPLLSKVQDFFSTYFDYIYWPELGDEKQENLKLEVNLQIKKLINQELLFYKDFIFPRSADLSFANVKTNYVFNAFPSDLLPLELEKLQSLGFETIKFKITKNFEQEIRLLLKQNLNHFEIRLDFNSCLETKNISDAYSALKKIPNLEYLEDPTPYSEKEWTLLASLFPLAYDQIGNKIEVPKMAQYVILKPTRSISYDFILKLISENKKITVTNMMDSPVGTWRSYLYYSFLKKEFPKNFTTPGLQTFSLFENHPFDLFYPFQTAICESPEKRFGEFFSFLKSTEFRKSSALQGLRK